MNDRLLRLGHAGGLVGAVAGLVVLVAALPWLRGDDPARTVLLARQIDREPDPAALAAVRSELHLATNPVAGALDWLAGAVSGDLGRSWVDGTPVRESLADVAAVSAGLAAATCTVAVAVGLMLIAPIAWRATSPRHKRPSGLLATAASLAGLPDFVLATVLLTVVAVRWRLAPSAGWSGPSSMVLPALALGVPTGGRLARLVATGVDAAAAEPWVRTWLCAGCGRATLALAIARRAGTAAVPQVAVVFAGLLGGAVVVEQLFAIPGAGRLALRAALAQDLPLLQGCVCLLLLAGTAAGALGIAAHHALLGPAGTAGLTPQPGTGHASRCGTPLTIAAVLAVTVVAGLLRDPDRVHLDHRLAGPSWAYPFGNDPVGRDVLAQFGHGALLTVGTATAVAGLALTVGLAVGVCGTRARVGVPDILYPLPPVLVGLVLAGGLGPGLPAAAAAAALVAWVPLAVHARNLAGEIRASGYYQAAVLGGAGSGWLARRHLLPAVMGPVAVHALIRIPRTALAIAALSYLGLGAGHDTAEWGQQLAAAVPYLEQAPTAVAAPVLGLTLLGLLAGYTPDGGVLGHAPARRNAPITHRHKVSARTSTPTPEIGVHMSTTISDGRRQGDVRQDLLDLVRPAALVPVRVPAERAREVFHADGAVIIEAPSRGPDVLVETAATVLGTRLRQLFPIRPLSGDQADRLNLHSDGAVLTVDVHGRAVRLRDPNEDYLFMRCATQAPAGGHSFMVDGYRLVDQLATGLPALHAFLTGADVDYFGGWTQPGRGTAATPLVRRLVECTRAGRRIVRASDYACPVPREPEWDVHEERLREYADVLATCAAATPRFRLDAGEILAMDNYRFLHGRDGYTGTRSMHVLSVLSSDAM